MVKKWTGFKNEALEQSWEKSHKIIYKQGYHWLIIAQNKQGWWLVIMFSRWGSYPKSSRITAKQQSSQTAIAIAVQILGKGDRSYRKTIEAPETF